jgi:cell division protein FtsB
VRKGRVVGLVAVVGGVVFGFAGGEYGTLDWWQLHSQIKAEQAALDSLTADVDSLTKVVRAIERNPAEVERVAREKYGMLRPGELLFQIQEPEQP